MPHSSTKFTDHHLKLLFGNVLNHYQECKKKPNSNVNSIYSEMYQAVHCTLETPHGSLYYLELSEKQKAYKAFHTILYALPLYSEMTVNQWNDFKLRTLQSNTQNVVIINQYNYSNPTVFDWLLLRSIMHSNHHHHSHHPAYRDNGCWPSHQHEHAGKENSDFAKFKALLFLFALAASAAVLAAIALYYMLNEFFNSMERFWYGEGWLKAALMLANTAAFGAGSTLLSLAFASTPLIALALTAGLNPIGVVIAATVLLGIIGAGIGCLAMSFLYDSINENINQDAMDPADPERFRLTVSEERVLLSKNIEPIKVKCAIVALRAEIANELGNENRLPSFFNRHFGSGAKVQELLQKVRALREGDLSQITVGQLYFDCNATMLPNDQIYNYQPNPVQPTAFPLNTNYGTQTSTAPLADFEVPPPPYSPPENTQPSAPPLGF